MASPSPTDSRSSASTGIATVPSRATTTSRPSALVTTWGEGPRQTTSIPPASMTPSSLANHAGEATSTPQANAGPRPWASIRRTPPPAPPTAHVAVGREDHERPSDCRNDTGGLLELEPHVVALHRQDQEGHHLAGRLFPAEPDIGKRFADRERPGDRLTGLEHAFQMEPEVLGVGLGYRPAPLEQRLGHPAGVVDPPVVQRRGDVIHLIAAQQLCGGKTQDPWVAHGWEVNGSLVEHPHLRKGRAVHPPDEGVALGAENGCNDVGEHRREQREHALLLGGRLAPSCTTRSPPA